MLIKSVFVKMNDPMLFSNSNEIVSLIQSLSGWEVRPLVSKEEECPESLLVFDILFYQLPKEEWTVSELLEKRPEWEKEILPLFKAKRYAFLFTGEWYVMRYSKETNKISFRAMVHPYERLDGRDCLYSTEPLCFMHQQEIKRLIEPAIQARVIGESLRLKFKRPVDMGVPITFRGLCDRMEDLMVKLNGEIAEWKDRFFFDALETEEDDLCYECKEEMRQTFYVREDQSQALKWKPHGDWCSQKECKYYKMHLFHDWYLDTDARETPVEYVPY